MHYAAISLISQQNGSDTNPHYSLHLDQAYQQSLGSIKELEAVLTSLSSSSRQYVLFLLDGFDEIATQNHAIDTISEDIRQLGNSFSWILSSRYTGFYGNVNHDSCYEMVSLNKEGIEELVTSWFSNALLPQKDLATQLVLKQINENSRLRDTARNPFLLTLLCYVQSTNLKQLLPLQRSDIYAGIINLIRKQLRFVQHDPTLFQKLELDYLSSFCHFLYTQVENAPLQIFELDHWNESSTEQSPPDFNKHFLPSRLIHSWQQDGDYHFTHLTFQEYLIALHLSKQPFESVRQHLFNPQWKVIYRFLAGIYGRQAKQDNYIGLMKALLDPVDKMGLLYIEASQLLIETGIEDSSQILGYDLREKLWEIWTGNAPYARESAGEALAILSPHYVIRALLISLEQASAPAILIIRSITLLGLVDDPEADELLVDLYQSENDKYAIAALAAMAEKNTSSIRAAVLNLYLQDKPRWFSRLCRMAEKSKHKSFLPHLTPYLSFRPDNLEDYEALFKAFTAIGAVSTDQDLITFIKQYSVETLTYEALEAVISLRTSRIKAWLIETMHGASHSVQNSLIYLAIQHSLFSPEQTAEYLHAKDPEDQHAYVNAIHLQLENGIQPSELVAKTIAEIAFSSSPNNVRAFTVLRDLDVHKPNDKRLANFNKKQCRHYLDHPELEMVTNAMDILAGLKDVQSFDKILNMAMTYDLSTRVVAIQVLCDYHETFPDIVRNNLHKIYKLEKNANTYLAREALTTLGKISIEELIPYYDDPETQEVLMKFCTTEGSLLFDDYFIDRLGQKHYWKTSPNSAPALDPNIDAIDQLDSLRNLCNYLLKTGQAQLTAKRENNDPPPLFNKNTGTNISFNSIDINTGKRFLNGGKLRADPATKLFNRVSQKFSKHLQPPQ